MAHTAAHILVVDDELPIRTMLAALLRRRGFTVTIAATGEEALDVAEQYPLDLLLLDLHLPGLSGMEVANRIRERHVDPAIIILTAYGSLDTALESMRLGVCDYIQKTASPHEVVARVASVIEQRQKERRRQQLVQTVQMLLSELGTNSDASLSQYGGTGESGIVVGDLEISTWRQMVRRGNHVLRLTPTQFRVLLCLAQHAGQVMTYQHILQCVKGGEAGVTVAHELIKPHIYHLRQKLEPNPGAPRYILTVRGTGYLLAAHPAAEPPEAVEDEELVAVS